MSAETPWKNQRPERTVRVAPMLTWPPAPACPNPWAARSLPFLTPYRTLHRVRWTSNPAAERDALAMAIGPPVACEQPSRLAQKCNGARVRSLLLRYRLSGHGRGGHDGLHVRRRESTRITVPPTCSQRGRVWQRSSSLKRKT